MTTDWLGENKDLLKFKSYSDLVENLYQNAILDSFQRLQAIPGIGSNTENVIRNHLAYDLEKANSILQPYLQKKILKLTKENTILPSSTTTRRTDIEFFMSSYGDFVVECKNLRSADQRYINDGLIRFTNEVYSTEDSEAGMIGFIVGGDIAKIQLNLHNKLKGHGTYLVSPLASSKCNGYVYSFHSTHKRTTKSAIYIHHLLINLR